MESSHLELTRTEGQDWMIGLKTEMGHPGPKAEMGHPEPMDETSKNCNIPIFHVSLLHKYIHDSLHVIDPM